MPIYEYRCASCGHEKEVLQRMSDKPLTQCPECGKRNFHKLVSAAGFHLKGTGWYATDFKNSGAKPAAKSEKPEAKSEKPEAKSEKPEAKRDQPADSVKPAASSNKESSKSESSTSAGTPPA